MIVFALRSKESRLPATPATTSLIRKPNLTTRLSSFLGVGILVFDQRVPVACDPSYSATYTKPKHNCLGFFTFEWLCASFGRKRPAKGLPTIRPSHHLLESLALRLGFYRFWVLLIYLGIHHFSWPEPKGSEAFLFTDNPFLMFATKFLCSLFEIR